VRYLKCDVPDVDSHEDLPQVLAAAARFMAAKSQDGAGLVRLHGQSRSASVVCAYLVLMRQLSVDDAWRVFKDARIQVDERLVWWDALRQLPAPAPALTDGPRTLPPAAAAPLPTC